MGIGEFHDFATVDADEVVVAGFLDEVRVVGLEVAAEVDFVQQPGLYQQRDGPIDRGTGHPGIRLP